MSESKKGRDLQRVKSKGEVNSLGDASAVKSRGTIYEEHPSRPGVKETVIINLGKAGMGRPSAIFRTVEVKPEATGFELS